MTLRAEATSGGRADSPELSEALHGIASFGEKVFAIWLLLLFLSLSFILPSLRVNIFNSPDETSNYIFTKSFAETGKLWYEKDYLYLDEENLLHPRGVITQNDRAVPYSFLGLPVIYGGLYRVLGDNLHYLALGFAAVAAWALFRATHILFKAKAWEAWVVGCAFTPLIYYLNRPFMNVTPLLVTLFVGIWLFARYYERSSRFDFVLAASAAALAIFFRYEYVLFVTPLMLWALYMKHSSLTSRAYLADVSIFGGAVLLLFVLPTALLNQSTYGSWSTYGPGLFTETYFPERVSSDGGSVMSALHSVRSLLLPSYPFNPMKVLQNIPRLTLWLMPVFTLVAVTGAWLLVTSRRVSIWKLAPLALLVVYVLVYRGSSSTWASDWEAPTFEAAIVRYWLPVYVFLFFLAVYALTRVSPQVKAVFIVGLLVTGPASIYHFADGSLESGRDTLVSYQRAAQNQLSATETNALIYASLSDKWIAPYRDVATWWNGAEFYDPTVVAASMARVSETGRPVYVFRESEVDINGLNRALAPYELEASWIGQSRLYEIEPTNKGD